MSDDNTQVDNMDEPSSETDQNDSSADKSDTGSDPEEEKFEAEPLSALIASERDFARRRAAYETVANRADYLDNLKEAARLYLQDQTFRPGDVVSWKRGLRNKAFPHYGRPAVVIRYLSEDETSSLRPGGFFGIPEGDLDDILIGFLDGDEDLSITRVDSRRLEPWVD